jgi:preprotein translocase subunit SecA
MRIFGGHRMQNLMLRLGMEEDVPIESKLITKRIAAAQKAVEAQHFASRKHVLEYDDVMNKQRQAVYSMRNKLLEGEDQKPHVLEIIEGVVAGFIDLRCPEKAHPSTYDWTSLESDILTQFGVKIRTQELQALDRREIESEIHEQLLKRYAEKEELIGPELMREMERVIMLNVIDNQWKDHLLSMDHLKEGIGMRAYGQKDPLIEYKKESFVLFQDMMDRIEDEAVRFLFFMQRSDDDGRGGAPGAPPMNVPHPELWDEEEEEELEAEPAAVGVGSEDHRRAQQAAQNSVMDLTRTIQRKKEKELAALQFVGGDSTTAQKPVIAKDKGVGRNDPCPCGSGKKYKKCHGA